MAMTSDITVGDDSECKNSSRRSTSLNESGADISQDWRSEAEEATSVRSALVAHTLWIAQAM